MTSSDKNSTVNAARRRFLQHAGAFSAAVAGGGFLSSQGRAAVASTLPAKEVTGFDLEGVTLTLLANAAHGKSWEHISELFKKQTGGTLKTTAVPYTQLAQKQLLDVQSGAHQYDLFQYQHQTLGTLVSANALADLTAWIEANPKLNLGDLPKSLYDSGSLFNGKRYGLPLVAVPDLLFYNKEILDKYALKPPTTWEEFRHISEEVTGKGGGKYYGAALQAQKDPTTILMTYGNRLAGFGGDYFDGAGNPVLNSSQAIAALEEFKKQLPSALPDPAQTAWQQATSAFLQGKTALHDSWGDVAYVGNDPTQSSIVGKYGTLSLPTGGANKVTKPVWVNPEAFAVSASSKKQDKAAQFLKWVLQPEVNTAITATPGGNWPVVQRTVLASSEYRKVNPFADQVLEQFDGPALVWPTGVNAVKAAQDLADQVSAALTGLTPVKEALDKAQKSWETELGKA
jgi:multiple sugar transport system substrate-binding protein